MSSKISWGVLSTAKIGVEKVLPAMQKGDRSRIDAIASRDMALAKDWASKLGIPKAYGSYEDLLADPAIQAIYNPLPNHLHVPWTIAAMEAGKHVLCEKPIALDATQASLLVEARERTGKIVAEAFMVRHNPQWIKAHEIAHSGRIGDVRAIQTFFSYFLIDPSNVRNQADIGGGSLFDIGCYAINTARYIFASEPERVVSTIERDPVMKTDRLTSALIEFPNSRHLTFTVSTQLSPHQRVTIVGTKGRIEVLIPFNAPNNLPNRIVVDDGRDLLGGGAETIDMPVDDQYRLQGDAFSRAVAGEEDLRDPIEDAVQNMRVIDACFRSASTGAWEKP